MLVAALGFTVVGAGLALLVLPGPGVIVIIVGLAILATEFAWAERALDKTLGKASQAAGSVTGNLAGRVLLALSGCALIAAGVVVMMLDSFQRWQSAGVGLIIAGTAGLATLLPPVQAWIAREQAKRREPGSLLTELRCGRAASQRASGDGERRCRRSGLDLCHN